MNKHFSFLPAATLAALLTFAPVVADGAAPQKNVLKYDIFAGGFQALKGGLTVDLSANNYRIELTAKTQNFIGDLFPWSGSYQSHGHIDHGKTLPEQHVSKSVWKGSLKTVEMHYDGSGKLVKFSSLQGDKNTVTETFTPDLTSGAVDMLTATLMMMQSVTEHHECKGSFPVYDGKRRFNINLIDAGSDIVQKSKYSVFTGEALRCSLKVEPVAGFKKRDLKRGWMAVQAHTEERAKLPTIWFAQVSPGSPMLPVRMEIASAYGAVVAHLASVK